MSVHQQQGKRAMRISDDRYSRERLSLELALRFLRHEARTQTIRAWTGLSDDRIRKLYRSYMNQAPRYLPRHRGKSPHQVAYFTRSLRVQQETAVLASLLSLLGVVPAQQTMVADTTHPLPSVARGELLCQAFEAYRALIPSSQISFEHAVFLATALTRGDQLRLGGCADCGSLVVMERFPVRDKRCHHCASPVTPR
jgi:recombinational DNA repair protein (RecF pathway)